MTKNEKTKKQNHLTTMSHVTRKRHSTFHIFTKAYKVLCKGFVDEFSKKVIENLRNHA